MAQEKRQYCRRCLVFSACLNKLSKWDSDNHILTTNLGKDFIRWLEQDYHVFFSAPFDLDFAMASSFRRAYGIGECELVPPDEKTILSVLGKSAKDAEQYSTEQQAIFTAYHRVFKLGSKPVAHIAALAELTDENLRNSMPAPLARMMVSVRNRIAMLLE